MKKFLLSVLLFGMSALALGEALPADIIDCNNYDRADYPAWFSANNAIRATYRFNGSMADLRQALLWDLGNASHPVIRYLDQATRTNQNLYYSLRRGETWYSVQNWYMKLNNDVENFKRMYQRYSPYSAETREMARRFTYAEHQVNIEFTPPPSENWRCVARDSGSEEHWTRFNGRLYNGHVGSGHNQNQAQNNAMNTCLSLHGSCYISNCWSE